MRQSILSLAFIFSMSVFASATNSNVFPDYLSLELEQLAIEDKLFNVDVTTTSIQDVVTIDSIHIVEVEEETTFDFDTSKYLPEDFNALKGKNTIDWETIEIIEIEEENTIEFDTKAYLPKGFNPYKGMPCKATTRVVSVH